MQSEEEEQKQEITYTNDIMTIKGESTHTRSQLYQVQIWEILC